MRIPKNIFAFLPLCLLFLVAMGCAGFGDKNCGSGPKAEMLKRILNASDNGAFNRALSEHGAITQEELPCILSAIESWSSTKRQNGARLLVLVGGDAKVVREEQEKVVLKTDDLFVWAKVMDSLMDRRSNSNPAALASQRHDMIKRALTDTDGFIQSVGLKAGVLGKYPGIEAELTTRLDSEDFKLLEVALDALPPETARAQQQRLLQMLDDYEAGRKYTQPGFKIYFFAPLLHALIRTNDAGADMAVRTALEKGYKNADRVDGTREEFSNFRNRAAVLRPDSAMKRFCYYLIEENSILKPSAIDILTTQVWAGKQEPTADIVKTCIETIESGNPDPTYNSKHLKDKPEQIACERFFYYLETGQNPMLPADGKKRKIGTDAVEIGREWLKKNQ